MNSPKAETTWVGGIAQTVKYLTSKHEALSSNPSTTEKKKMFIK
jgi:hypothetical protein